MGHGSNGNGKSRLDSAVRHSRDLTTELEERYISGNYINLEQFEAECESHYRNCIVGLLGLAECCLRLIKLSKDIEDG